MSAPFHSATGMGPSTSRVNTRVKGPSLSTWRMLIGSAHFLALLLIGASWSPWAAVVYGLGLVSFFGYRFWKMTKLWPGRPQLQFTKEGRYMVAITLGVGLAAINTGNNLLYLFLGMLLSMIIVSGVLSELTLRNLEVTRKVPRPVFARVPFLTEMVVRNRKMRLPSFSLQVEDVIASVDRSKKCYFLKIPATQTQRTSYRVSLPRRGLYAYEGVRLSTRFPFGFFIKSRLYTYPTEVLVYPAIRQLTDLSLNRLTGEGASRRPRRGLGREFHTLRRYVEGDDARDIHWKRTARDDRLMLKEYEAEGTHEVRVILHNRLPPGEPEETAIPLGDALVDYAASLVLHFSERGFRVTLLTLSGSLRIEPGGEGVNPCLQALALLGFENGHESGDRWLIDNPMNTPAVLVSDARMAEYVVGSQIHYVDHEEG